MKKSEFKRIKSESLPQSGLDFLKEANYKTFGGVLDAWVKGDPETSKEFVLVMIDDSDSDTLNNVLFRNAEGTIETVPCTSMYQTFLAHKAARIPSEPTESIVVEPQMAEVTE